MVDDLGWWAVPIVAVVIFTLYGIEGIGSQLEDPFGYDRNDIKMDAIVEDEKVEIEAVLREWKRVTAALEAVATAAGTTSGNSTNNGVDGPAGEVTNGQMNGQRNGQTNGKTDTFEEIMPKKEMFIR
jgi:putative membrane protein